MSTRNRKKFRILPPLEPITYTEEDTRLLDSPEFLSDLINLNNKYYINFYLQNNGYVDTTDSFGNSLLMLAIKSNYIQDDMKMLDIILRYNPNLDIQNSLQQTALHLACDMNNFKIIKKLVNAGSDLNIEDKNHITPLMISIFKRNIRLTKYLLSNGSETDSNSISQNTPLHIAVRINNLEGVKLLFEYKANPFIPGLKDGIIPLHLASRDKNTLEILRFLLEKDNKKIGISIRNHLGNYALNYAVNSGNYRAASFILSQTQWENYKEIRDNTDIKERVKNSDDNMKKVFEKYFRRRNYDTSRQKQKHSRESKKKKHKKTRRFRKNRKSFKMRDWWANLPESDYSHYDNYFYMYFVPKDKEDFRSLGLLLSFLGISYAAWKLYPISEKIKTIKEYLTYKFYPNCSELTQSQANNEECNGDMEFITYDDIDYTRPQDYYIFHDSKHCIKKTDWPKLLNGPTGYTNPMTRQAAYCN